MEAQVVWVCPTCNHQNTTELSRDAFWVDTTVAEFGVETAVFFNARCSECDNSVDEPVH